MSSRWVLREPSSEVVSALSESIGISRLLARCLANRGFTDPADALKFLDPRLKDLTDPFELPGMADAVERIHQARQRKEAVVVFGDYDVDGITSTALLHEALATLGLPCGRYLPHRLQEGYGLTWEGVENCLASHPATLLIAVDCGSTATEVIARLKREKGVEVIVLDHHQIADPAPKAAALINPQLLPPEDPRRWLCSAALAFKLAHALVKAGRAQNCPISANLDVRDYLDLVALATIADIMPLRGENRSFVTAGLSRLAMTRRPGLEALKNVADVKGPPGVHTVAFQLAPRLNASGRLESARTSLELLLATEPGEAASLAAELDAQNRDRQRIERTIFDAAHAQVRSGSGEDPGLVIVVGDQEWHPGVVGIVASRLVREFHRPCFVLGGDSAEEWRGSGRSVEGFDLAASLRECDGLLLRHGGHAAAAGLAIHPGNIDALRAQLNAIGQRILTPEMLTPRLNLDAEVALREVNQTLVADLARLQPFGFGNPQVQLVTRGVRLQMPIRRMGGDLQHARLSITDGHHVLDAVYWNCGATWKPPELFDIAFAPEINDFKGRSSVQLKLLDARPAA